MALAGGGQALRELRRGQPYAADSLYALNDAGADVALGQLGLPRGEVVQRQVADVAVGVDGRYNLRVVGGFDGQRRAPVERFLGREHAGAPVGKRGQLQRVLVGLSPAVDEEQLVVLIAAGPAKPFGQLCLQPVDDRVAVEAQAAQLRCHHLNVVGVAVAYAYHGVAAVKVKVLTAIGIPHVAAAALDDVYVEQWINVE